MGIDDRDYMREKRLRWDERGGEMRLDEPEAKRPASKWLAVGIAVLCAAVAAAAGWMWWRSQSAVGPGSVSEQSVEPAKQIEQRWAPEGPVLEGRVLSITDGDSIKVELASGPIEVRLHSIDAPERDQPGGKEARAALTRRLGTAEVSLEPVEQDQYGRMIAVVYQGDANTNAWLVRQGHAWVYRQYARDARYCEAEIAARSEKTGVWALPVAEQKAPWEWRAVKRGRRVGYSDYSGETLERCVAALGKRPSLGSAVDEASRGYRRSPDGHAVDPSMEARSRLSVPRDGPAGNLQHPHDAIGPQSLVGVLPASPSESEPGECRIKGNIGGSGKIYHLPGTAAYAKTRIDESKGERWFCSEDEARAAGWRAPRG